MVSKKSTERAATRKSSGGYVSVPQSYGVRTPGNEHMVRVDDGMLHIDEMGRASKGMIKGKLRRPMPHICPECKVRYNKVEHIPTCTRLKSQQTSRAFLSAIDMTGCIPGVTFTMTGLDEVTFTVTRY